jgi:uncharacterized protein YegP (UPF0339 family)
VKIEVFKGAKDEWYFHVLARNGKVVCASEGYKRRGYALRTIKRLQVGLYLADVVMVDHDGKILERL